MKVLICLSSDDRFAKGVAVMIYSLHKHNKFPFDVKVFYNNLSEESKSLILKVDPTVIFQKPSTTDFCKHSTTIYGNNNTDVYLCFESFLQIGYDKVICVDADMVCVGDLSRLIHMGHDFMAVRSNIKFIDYPEKFGAEKFNAGFFVVGKKYLNKTVYNTLTDLVITKTHNSSGADQDTLNIYFKDKVFLLDSGYNFKFFGGAPQGGNCGDHNMYVARKDRIKILHFTGRRKPWAEDETESKEYVTIRFRKLLEETDAYKIWKKCYKDTKQLTSKS